MRRALASFIVILVLLVPGVNWAGIEATSALDGLSTIDLFIEPVSKSCKNVRITNALLQHETELIVRSAGIELAKGDGSFLYVYIRCLAADDSRAAYSLRVAFYRPALVVPDKLARARVDEISLKPADFVGPRIVWSNYNAWSTGTLGISDNSVVNLDLLDDLAQSLSEFIDDFLEANPKK